MVALFKLFTEPQFSFKMAATSRKCQLFPISIDTWWYYWKFVPSDLFFSNCRHMVKISTLSDLNENWYLGVYWCGDHYGTMEKLFFVAICHLCLISMKNGCLLVASGSRWARLSLREPICSNLIAYVSESFAFYFSTNLHTSLPVVHMWMDIFEMQFTFDKVKS